MAKGVYTRRGRTDDVVVDTFPLPPGTTIEHRPRPQVPPDTIRLDQTPGPDGLLNTTIGDNALKRLSPFRSRWPEVLAFDERATRLEEKQADVNAELVASQQQLVQAQAADAEAMVVWVADNVGERPMPTAPGIEQRIADLTSERDALTIAAQHVLDAKADFVEKHRGRLVREAEKARALAAERLQETISAVEAARGEAVASVEGERWAREFPGERAHAGSLALQKIKGGRLSKALPEIKTQIVAGQVLELLRDDARWLDNVLADEHRRHEEVDPHFEPIWEETDEGRKAIQLANKRILEGLKPRHTRQAGWGD